MAAANGTGTAAMLGRVERRISRADRGRWVQLRGVSTASRLLGQCRRSRRRWRRRNLRILWRNDRLYSQIPRPFWRDLAGSGGNRRHRFVQLRCRPIGSFFTTARTNSRAVSLRDWNRLQFRRKKGFFPYASLSRRSTSGVSTGNSSKHHASDTPSVKRWRRRARARAHTRHTPDVCALRSLGHGCVQEVKNDINTVRFLTQTARFVS